MRSAVLSEMLAELDADHALPALGLLSDRAKSGHADARRVVAELALQTDLFKAIPYPFAPQLTRAPSARVETMWLACSSWVDPT